MDLIHSYDWALDDKDAAGFAELFTEDVVYEACKGGGTLQIFATTSREELRGWINGLFEDLNQKNLRTRHYESNTLLHVEDKDIVRGQTTLLVTLQSTHSEVPEFDYTAALKAIFEREEGVWKFARLTLITDTPEVEDRAR